LSIKSDVASLSDDLLDDKWLRAKHQAEARNDSGWCILDRSVKATNLFICDFTLVFSILVFRVSIRMSYLHDSVSSGPRRSNKFLLKISIFIIVIISINPMETCCAAFVLSRVSCSVHCIF
jgi:hypothetical protein